MELLSHFLFALMLLTVVWKKATSKFHRANVSSGAWNIAEALMQTLGLPVQMRILILILINVPCTNENTGFYTLVDLPDQDGLNAIRVLLALRKISTSL